MTLSYLYYTTMVFVISQTTSLFGIFIDLLYVLPHYSNLLTYMCILK